MKLSYKLFTVHLLVSFALLVLVGMVQGYEFEGYRRTIDTHIKNLRKKIAGHLPGKDVIHSVYGTGYRFSMDTVKS